MANASLPDDFDIIILGTGLVESITAAAFSRVGYKVLHMDMNNYYGAAVGSFSFKGLRERFSRKENLDRNPENFESSNERIISLVLQETNFFNWEEEFFIFEDEATTNTGKSGERKIEEREQEQKVSQSENLDENLEPVEVNDNKDDTGDVSSVNDGEEIEAKKCKFLWTKKKMEQKDRHFNLDLNPRLLFCRGDMVDLLISSDVAKYVEFKTITRVLTRQNGEIKKVPCSRADVFSSKDITMTEKRILMKFLQNVIKYKENPDEFGDFRDRSFREYLESKSLPENIRQFIQNNIAMVNDNSTAVQGLEKTLQFVSSLGRYGNTAFLWPMFGSGELPQAFCRFCAVFGGIYCLERTAKNIIVDESNKVIGIIDTTGQRIRCKHLILNFSYASENLLNQHKKKSEISRGIVITDKPIKESSQEELTLMNIPKSLKDFWSLFEVSNAAGACPDGLNAIYLKCNKIATAKSDLLPVVQDFCSFHDKSDEKPQVIYSCFYNQSYYEDVEISSEDCPCNAYITSELVGNLDLDDSVSRARLLFRKICKTEEFLPKAPNPEDIIFEDPSEALPSNGFGDESSQSDEEEKLSKENSLEQKDSDITVQMD